ncbi:MAG: AbrB family transcriptional regulator [Candidatus Rokuibacteriota bacterium]|nr:MAG: AbrB family transcriptional regulator [Candidatus Rokubacteria bacterium]
MKVVKTSTKGQVVIPAGLRAQIGLRPGAKVVVRLTGDGAVQIRPLPKNPVAAGFGLFVDGPSLTAALKGERKAEREREEKKLARFMGHAGVPAGRPRRRPRSRPHGGR